VAASEALAVGWGGITLVAWATALSRAPIGLGVKELRGTVAVAAGPGAPARRRAQEDGGHRPSVLADLERLVEPTAPGTRSRLCTGPARGCARWRRRWAR
jgi:hypothetical protein